MLFRSDADDDGFGDASAPLDACEAPAGFVASAGDCADGDAAVHPGAAEACNAIDDDCDGAADPGASTWADTDGDGYGDPEACDGEDDDCDGVSDPGVVSVWYSDADGDGYGLDADGVEACVPPADTVAVGGDCDGDDAAVHPDADEACNTIDDDSRWATSPGTGRTTS